MKHSFIRAFGGAVMALALLGAVAGCGGDGGGGAEGTTVKIGFMGALTGDAANIVIPPNNGAKLAIEEYNAKNPKVKIELVNYDSQGAPEQAPQLAQKAIQDGVVGMIGPAFSGESKAVGDIFEKAKIPSVSPSATALGLGENDWKYWHRVVANDGEQGPAGGVYIADKIKAKKAFVIDDKQEYSVGLGDAVTATLKEKGVTVGTDKINKEAADFSSTVNKVKAFNPGAIFYAGYYAEAGRLLKQLRDAGVEAPYLSGDGSLDAQLVEGAGKAAAEGALLVCPCNIGDPDDADAKKFADAYKKEFNTDPAIYATEGYDAATAFIKAIEAGNTDKDKINEFLGTVDFKGVSKQIKFKDNGELEGGLIFLYKVTDGAIAPQGLSEEAEYSK